MRLLVNTLSIGSLSGEHVVYGFLRELVRSPEKAPEMTVLHYTSQRPPEDLLSLGVGRVELSDRLRPWALRTGWEIGRLPALAKKLGIERILNVSGGITPWLRTPQVSLAMNPWCYVADARSGWRQEIKAFMQRRNLRHAFRNAEHMIYISAHLRDLYRAGNRDCLDREVPSTIAHVGLDDALFEAAERLQGAERNPHSILSVSVWARWKGVETVLQALRLLRTSGTPATLSLVGPWPDRAYRQRVESLIAELGLEQAVHIHGKVMVDELYRHYATHQVFCLMSPCESFGIPAAEAMAFGTPVVSTDCCAIMEVCNEGGLFVSPNDPRATADALARLLSDPVAAHPWSERARSRADTLKWSLCSSSFKRSLGIAQAAEFASGVANNAATTP